MTTDHNITIQSWLLACGIAAAAVYPLSDIYTATQYPGYSYLDQAVSELFAIGAPTSTLVVSLFSISSTLLFLFAIGIWMWANGRRWPRVMAVMMALNAIDALVLWNFFPMHMRGIQPTFTDLMHGLLAIDPFLLVGVVIAAILFRGWFRTYTITMIVFTTALALSAMWYIPLVVANQPTPWMGSVERLGQYVNNLWYAVFALVLLRQPQKIIVGSS